MKVTRCCFICLILLMLTFLALPVLAEEEASLSTIPNDATWYKDHAYYIYNEMCSWEEAKTKCEEKNGHLLTITSSEEQAIIEDLLKMYEKKEFWIGITDLADKGNWSMWITNEPVTFSNWGFGVPDNYRGIQDYGIIVSGEYSGPSFHIAFGQWDDAWYDENSTGRAYICEWETSDGGENSLGETTVWNCPECGRTGNTGNFCGGCGYPAP